MKNKYTHSLLVFVKNKYKYGNQEEKLGILADKLGGKEIGGGTCLSTGKRDKQFYFQNKQSVDTFLDYPTVKETILKEYDLVELSNVWSYQNVRRSAWIFKRR